MLNFGLSNNTLTKKGADLNLFLLIYTHYLTSSDFLTGITAHTISFIHIHISPIEI